MWNLFLSTTGCFLFIRGCRLVLAKEEGSKSEASTRVSAASHEPLAGSGARAAATDVSDCSAF
jgi:hypothetical protein